MQNAEFPIRVILKSVVERLLFVSRDYVCSGTVLIREVKWTGINPQCRDLNHPDGIGRWNGWGVFQSRFRIGTKTPRRKMES